MEPNQFFALELLVVIFASVGRSFRFPTQPNVGCRMRQFHPGDADVSLLPQQWFHGCSDDFVDHASRRRIIYRRCRP
jgi:hypothetical protein